MFRHCAKIVVQHGGDTSTSRYLNIAEGSREVPCTP
jgi:hypothetical protein